MLSLKEIMSFFEGRFSLFGVYPLFCYFGGSLANDSYIAGSSDMDVIVVVENKPNIFFKGEVRGERYSFIFDSLDEYLRQENMAKYSTSRLYGYLNFSFLSEKEIIFFDEMIEAPGIVNNAHLNGEKAAVELFSRIKELKGNTIQKAIPDNQYDNNIAFYNPMYHDNSKQQLLVNPMYHEY